MSHALVAIREAAGQLYGYARWCLPAGHLWSGPDPDRAPDLAPPDWRGICVTCGLVAKPRPAWRRFILMGDCVPSEEPGDRVTLDNSDARFTPAAPSKSHYPDTVPRPVYRDPLPRPVSEHCRPGRCLGLTCCSYECSQGRCPSIPEEFREPAP